MVRVNQTADPRKVARLELADCRADLSDAANNFMTGNTWIDSGHNTAPLVPDRMEIGVTDAAEEYLNLNVVFGCFTS